MKISIITATYNSAATVRDTLESVLQQTHQDWELIIEDGLSKDDTLSIVREYEPLCKGRMRIYSEKDNGIYDAMNRGIARATGEIIGILNSDDFYHDERVLADINRAMEEQPVDCIYGDLKYIQADNKTQVVRIWKSSQHENGAFLRGWHPAHPTFYARRSCYERLGMFDTSFPISADFELMLRLIEKHQLRSRYLPHCLVRMREGGESNGTLHNVIRGNRNIMRAFRKNGVPVSCLYPIRRLLPKIAERIKSYLFN